MMYPAPYQDDEELRLWKARYAALDGLSRHVVYAGLDEDDTRAQRHLGFLRDGLEDIDQFLPDVAPSLVAEREAAEEAQRLSAWRDAQIRACYWEWFVIGFILTCIALLVYRNWPGIREWEGWR